MANVLSLRCAERSQQMPHENLVGVYRTCSAPVRTVANLMDGEPWQCRSCSCIAVLTTVLLFVTLVEFPEMRNRHRARRAIEQSAGTNQPEPPPELPAD